MKGFFAATPSCTLLLALVSVCASCRLTMTFVLGAQILASDGEVVPAFHCASRAAAAAVLYSKWGCNRICFSGGYNVGVRYWLNGTLLAQANFSFAAFAAARAWPSEGGVMQRYVETKYGVPLEATLVESVSATTEENGRIGAILLQRTGFIAGSGLPTAVLTNLFHMPRAFPLFVAADTQRKFCPVFAEDMVALLGDPWIKGMVEYYSVPRGGTLFNATAIGNIMAARHAGDLTRSVAEMVSMGSCDMTQLH